MELTKSEEIQKYNFEEILMILFILSTDLSSYDEDKLVFFAECIEGRIEILFNVNFILSLKGHFKKDELVVEDFDDIKNRVTRLYSSQWHKKLKGEGSEIMKVRLLAKSILNQLEIAYIEPLKFLEGHMG